MDQITRSFFASMESIKKNIDENKNIEGIQKYIIYFSLLDVLGKYAFPNKKYHNERYKKLLQCFSCWKYKKYISSLQLECILPHINKKLRPFIKAKIGKNPLTDNNFFSDIAPADIVPADEVDFTEEKLKEGLNSFQLELYEKNIGAIHQARYDNLFYRLRCFVVHQFKLPTPNALDLDEDSEIPMYVYVSSKDGDGYRLWFSPKVILLILRECIEKTNRKINYDYRDIFELIPKCWIGKSI